MARYQRLIILVFLGAVVVWWQWPLYFSEPSLIISPQIEIESGQISEEMPSMSVLDNQPELEIREIKSEEEIEKVITPSPVLPVVDKEPIKIDFSVPFTSQAPRFLWSDPRQQDACEEASALMAMAWVRQETQKTPIVWEEKILALADWEQENYGEHRDVSVEDVVAWIFNDYFSYSKVRIKSIYSPEDILDELEAGNLVLAPANGQALNNPNFTSPGPAHHFLLIKGYDYQTEEFITNDPGTRLGADYRYPAAILYNALRAYPTGYHGQYEELKKLAIIVEK